MGSLFLYSAVKAEKNIVEVGSLDLNKIFSTIMGSHFALPRYEIEAPLPSIEVKLQMHYIISNWYKSSMNMPQQNTLFEFPMDIINMIIDQFLYQTQFEICHQTKLKNKNENNNNNTSLSCDYLFKIQMIGDFRVGKKSFLLRYIDDEFLFKQPFTTMIESFRIKMITFKNKRIKLQIYDGYHGSDWQFIRSATYYREVCVHGIMMFYDVTDRQSFINIKSWNDHIKKYAPANVRKIIIGCKLDLKDELQHKDYIVKDNEVKKLAESLNIPSIETSAKLGVNVNEAVELILNELYECKLKPFYG